MRVNDIIVYLLATNHYQSRLVSLLYNNTLTITLQRRIQHQSLWMSWQIHKRRTLIGIVNHQPHRKRWSS